MSEFSLEDDYDQQAEDSYAEYLADEHEQYKRKNNPMNFMEVLQAVKNGRVCSRERMVGVIWLSSSQRFTEVGRGGDSNILHAVSNQHRLVISHYPGFAKVVELYNPTYEDMTATDWRILPMSEEYR